MRFVARRPRDGGLRRQRTWCSRSLTFSYAAFRYSDETIALILAFVGIKILAADLVHISDLASLAVIGILLAGGIVASLAADRLDPPHPAEEATAPGATHTSNREGG